MRSLIDWEYYKERVGSTILKIVTIPAALQNCQNPFPKVPYPEWLKKKVKELSSVFKQKKLTDFLQSSNTINVFSASGLFNQNIEDVGKPKFRELNEKEKQAIEKRKEKEEKEEEDKRRIEEEEKNPISIDDDFQGWLRCQKRFWRKYRKQRKEDPLGLVKQSDIVSIMKNFDQVFYKSTLQILQIQKTTMPGVLRVWVRLPNNLMYHINLQVHRRILINSKTEQPEAIKVVKVLPRDRSSKFKQYHLYQIEQDEEVFLNKLDDLMHYHLSNVDIDGVYETQVPLEFRVILDCGNFVTPRSSIIDKTQSALNRTYSLTDLAPASCTSGKMFRDMNKVLIYYSHTRNRHFMGVYIP